MAAGAAAAPVRRRLAVLRLGAVQHRMARRAWEIPSAAASDATSAVSHSMAAGLLAGAGTVMQL